MIGQILGHYRIVEKIGAGGMGEVYRAHDEQLDRDVALKVLPAGTLADEAARKQFRKEALALSKLNHPNIGTIHDFGTQEGVDFLVMEYIAGTTLTQKLAGGALREKEVLALGAQIAGALEEAHEKGVVHRDLKPGNILVTPKGQAKVLDFGLAKLLWPVSGTTSTTEMLSDTAAVVGTLPYMAPEQLQGEPADARTDIHALGSVLYEMATGQRAFREELASRLIDAILHQLPVSVRALNARISPELERIVLKCLEKDPENRYQSAKELAVDLRADSQRLKREADSARVAVPSEAIAKPRWLSRPMLLVAASLVVAVFAAGMAGLWWYRTRTVPAAPAVAAKPSIAVLPLQNLSGDPANDYFSDGMTEEISTKLSHIGGLKVASHSSVTRFKGTQKDPQEIARELQARYLLQGSVRKAENQVRINVQLTDSSTGFQVWADDFVGELKDVFALQEQTALKIAGALNLRLSPQEEKAVERRYTQNAEAYDAYLRGRVLIEYFDRPEKLEAARRNFEHALQSDPNYTLALAGLAWVEGQYYRSLDPDEAHLRRAEELAQRALAIDPRLAEAHVALGTVYVDRYEYARAAEEFRTATRLDPDNAYAWMLLSWALGYEQPPEASEAEKAGREAIRLQPSLYPAYYELGRALLLQGRYSEAIAAFEHARELSPTSPTPNLGLAQVYLAQKDYDRAITSLLKHAELTTGAPVARFALASAYAGRGDREKALAELQKAFAAGYRDFAAIDASPHFSSLRSDPRFQQLIRRYRR